MAESGLSFTEVLHILSLSKAPLSVRFDADFAPSSDELATARRAVSHVLADADVRSRLASFQVEPLVRAASILLEDCRRSKGGKGAPEAARSCLNYLIALDKAFGSVPSVLNNRGVARSLTGDFAGADADFAAARRLAPAFVAPRVNEIDLVRRSGDFTRLERIADEIERADPGNIASLRAAVDAKIALRRPPPDVLAVARRLYDAKGARTNDLFLLGSLSLATSDPAGSEAHLREFVAAEPRHLDGHLRLAEACLEQGKLPEALGVYEKLKQIDGPKYEYDLARALIFDQLNRLDDATAAYTSALANASARDREIVEEAASEFKARRGVAEASSEGTEQRQTTAPAASEPPPATSATESEDRDGALEDEPIGLPPPAEGLDTPFSDEDYEPRAIGDVRMLEGAEESIPGEGAEDGPKPPPKHPPPTEDVVESYVEPPPAPSPPTEPPPQPVAPEEERIAAALESGSDGIDAIDDILGEVSEPALPAPLPPVEPPPQPEPTDHVAIVAAAPAREDILPLEAPYDALAPAPPAQEPPPAMERPTPPRDASPQPIVSAPPPAREEPDPDLAAELEALARSGESPPEEPGSIAEAFRRPCFDVDEFMAALESKTKPAFDNLYDGMLEARRKEAAAPPVPKRSSTLYESAPPVVLPSPAPAPVAAAAQPAEAEGAAPSLDASPPIPLLLQTSARDALFESLPVTNAADAALFSKAQVLATAGDPAAETALDSHLAATPDDARAWNLKGDLRERAGDEKGALAAYWNSVKYDPSHKEAWNNLGVLLHLIGRFHEACQALESAVMIDAHDRHLWHNLGSTYHELGRLDDALSAFNRAIEVDAEDKVSHNNRGTTLFEKGDFAGARAAFERAVAIDPEFEQAHNNLGRALENLNDLEGALRAYQSALSHNERSVAALRNLARVFERLGRQGEASAARSKLRALGA